MFPDDGKTGRGHGVCSKRATTGRPWESWWRVRIIARTCGSLPGEKIFPSCYHSSARLHQDRDPLSSRTLTLHWFNGGKRANEAAANRAAEAFT
jgi:hypothetical protein